MNIRRMIELFDKHGTKLNKRYQVIFILWIEGTKKVDIAKEQKVTKQCINNIFKIIETNLEKYDKTSNN